MEDLMRKSVAFVAAIALAAALLTPVSAMAAAEHSAEDVVVVSDADGTEIAITVFRPATASKSSPAPVILHSHGWGGSRTAAIGGEIEAFLNAGFGVVSIDQRGHGASGGQ
ncbi:MAG: peptidase S15, partial [Actinobacteria bacterium]|nr:peptidase S15 [Actinomycetota bacterium]